MKIISIAVLTFAVANGFTPERKSQKQIEYERAIQQQAEFCAKYEPKIGQPTTQGGNYNYTEDLNH